MKTPITLDVRPRTQEFADALDALDVTPADANELVREIRDSLEPGEYEEN